MEWDQALYKKFIQFIKKKDATDESTKENPFTVNLSDIKDRLTFFARLINNSEIDIYEADYEGGYIRNAFFLAKHFNKFEDYQLNYNFYIYRISYLTCQKNLALNLNSNEYSLVEARELAKEHSSTILKKLFNEFPNCKSIYDSLLEKDESDSVLLYGKFMFDNILDESKDIKPDNKLDKNDDDDEITTERKAPNKEIVDVLTVEKEKIEQYNLLHTFEKVETLDEFKGSWRDMDGDDDLAEHEDALQEVDLSQTVRVNDPTHSIFQSDYLRNAHIPLSKENTKSGYFISYDEWNDDTKEYMKDFCKVYPSKVSKSNQEYVEKTLLDHNLELNKLKIKFKNVFNDFVKIRHLTSGDDIDLDKVVENLANHKAGKPRSEKIYTSKQKKLNKVSLLILLDLSLSADSFVDNKRILDIEKEAVILLSEVLSDYHYRFQIDAFCSQTRNNCDYMSIKGFNETWRTTKGRVGSLQANGYTRIGPAIRHATSLLAKEDSDKKWILLLSDGKASDYDRYEGRYGIEDVRKANREAKKKKINLFTLAIDSSAKHYLARMFTASTFKILTRIDKLTPALADFCLKLKK